MQRNLCAAFVILYMVFCGFTHSALAVDAAIRAPVNCRGASSCGGDLTIAQAALSWEEKLKRQPRCLERLAERKRLRAADPIFGELEDLLRFGPPNDCTHETKTNRHVCGSATTTGSYYFWAKVEDYKDGQSALAELTQRAREGSTFPVKDELSVRIQGNSPFVHYQIVEADNSTPTEQHLAMCRVTKSESGAIGPPQRCVTVAILTPEASWLRGGRDAFSCDLMSGYRASGSIKIEFEVITKHEPLVFARKLNELLATQLNLVGELKPQLSKEGTVDSVYLESTASLRDSKILEAGWRESFDFDVYIRKKDGKIAISGTLLPMVSRLAGGSLTSYHGPDDAQKSRYASVLDSSVSDAIKAACQRFEKSDAKTIVCD